MTCSLLSAMVFSLSWRCVRLDQSNQDSELGVK
jgi:hypothetical protein